MASVFVWKHSMQLSHRLLRIFSMISAFKSTPYVVVGGAGSKTATKTPDSVTLLELIDAEITNRKEMISEPANRVVWLEVR